MRARFCIMATGALSAARTPDIPGLADFAGQAHHTGQWPHEGVDFGGKRVAVIGTGSSGIQVIPVIAQQAAHLTVFQRTANFTIPAWNRPLTEAAQADWKAYCAEHRSRARVVGTLYDYTDRAAVQASDDERRHEYVTRWNKGRVNFVHAFNDLMVNKASNDTIADFVREQIRRTVHDPVTAEALSPRGHPLGTKRICVDSGYYATCNRPNVTLVDLRKMPIESITSSGIRTAAGEHALDAIVFATGYDALTGALARIDLQGLGGARLRDRWAQGPRTYLGLMTVGLPNLFIITGPGSPSVLVNMIVGIEQHVEWISRCLCDLRAQGNTRIDAQVDAQDRWVAHVNAAAGRTLFAAGEFVIPGCQPAGQAARVHALRGQDRHLSAAM